MAEIKKRGRPPVNKKEEVKTVPKQEVKIEEIVVVEKNEEIKEVIQPKQKTVKQKRDPNEMIDVTCIVHGGLNFVTSNGLEIVWDSYGDVYPLEYKELIYMLNKYKRFFEEPWVIMEQDVLEDLHATHYYKNIIDFENIDNVFTKTPEQIKELLDKSPQGIKRLIADKATSAIKEGTLDSMKIIEILQKELGIELT